MKRLLLKIAANIKKERVKSGVSFIDLAKRAKLSKGNLSAIENKPNNTSIFTLIKIARVLKISPRDLIPKDIE